MASVVQAVPNEAFNFPTIATRSGSVVTRTRSSIINYAPGTVVGHTSGAGGVSTTTRFDLMDPKRMILTKSMAIRATFIPQFYKQFVSASATTNVSYQEGTGPQIDGSLQCLAARIRIGTQQGHVIEEIFAYGLFSNMMETYMETEAHRSLSTLDHSATQWNVGQLPHIHDDTRCEVLDDPKHAHQQNSRLTDRMGKMTENTLLWDNRQPSITTDQNPLQGRTIVFNLHHSSFLNRLSVLPLNLFNYALSIEIEWQDPKYCFYNNWLGHSPKFGFHVADLEANTTCTFTAGGARGQITWTVETGAFNAITGLGAQGSAVYGLPGVGEFWILTKQGRVVTVVFAVYSSGADTASSVITLHGERSTFLVGFGGPNDPFRATNTFLAGVEVAALQRIWGGAPAGDCRGVNADPELTGVRGALFPFALATGSLGYTNQDTGEVLAPSDGDFSANGLVLNDNGLMKLFDTVWVLPISAAPITFNSSNGLSSRSVTSLAISGAPNIVAATVITGSGTTGASSLPANGGQSYPPQWYYALRDVKMIMDAILPSDPVRAVYRQAFMSPEGISYPFTRVLYQNFNSPNPPQPGWVQMQITARCKSLRSLYVVFTDTLYNTPSTGTDYSVYNYPCLSSYRLGSLTDAFLQVGGDRFPIEPLRFAFDQLEINHHPELMTCLNMAMGSNGAIPTFPPWKLHRESRNFGKAGVYSDSTTIVPWLKRQDISRGLSQDTVYTGAQNVSSYVDTSKFILAFNTSRVDGDMLSGIDVSAAGSLILNLYYPVSWGIRPFITHVFANCDAIFQLQENSSYVRM